MDRKEFEKIKGKERFGVEDKLIYLKRLMTPYDGNKTFLLQYLEADGNELHDKFWSYKSSSRFAFELYSWLANGTAKNFEFEKKLNGIKHASPPNMDLYFEIENRAIFIESKFSEEYVPTIDDLPDAYYKAKDEAYDSKGKNLLKSELPERYRKQKDIAVEIQKLVEKTRKIVNKMPSRKTWMYFKQEITHLVGIALTVRLDKTGYYKNKDIEFYNIYYDFGDDIEKEVEPFFTECQRLMSGLLKDYCKSFKYSHMSAQDMVKTNKIAEFNKDTKAFAANGQTIGEILEKKYLFRF